MDKRNRNKITIAVLVLVVGIVFSMFFSTILHKVLLSKQVTNLIIPKLGDCIKSILSSKQHLKLFLSFVFLSILVSIGLYSSSDRGYKSELQEITPNIYTPAKAGQNQHGSARWLTDKEKEETFTSLILDSREKNIIELIKEGYKDLEIMEGENNE